MADRPTRVRAAGYDATASLVATMRDTAVDAKDDAETAQAAAESAQSGAETARTGAEQAEQNAVDISNIAIDDDIVELLVKPGAAGPKTKAALSASKKSVYGTGPATGTDYANLTARIAACDAGGGGTVACEPGQTYVVASTLVLPSKVILDLNGSTLKLADGANCDVIQSENFGALVGSNSWFVSEGVPVGFGVINGAIDGNSANNTSGRGLAFYGKRYMLDDLIIHDTAETAWYSEAGAKGGQESVEDLPETTIGRVWIRNTGGHGLHWRGPHDGRIDSLVVALATGTGLLTETNGTTYDGPLDLGWAHIYSCGIGVQADQALRCDTLQVESNQAQGLILNAIHSFIGNLYAYKNQKQFSAGGATATDYSVDLRQQGLVGTMKVRADYGGTAVRLGGTGSKIAAGIIDGQSTAGTGLRVSASRCEAHVSVQNFSASGGIGVDYGPTAVQNNNALYVEISNCDTGYKGSSVGNRVSLVGSIVSCATPYSGTIGTGTDCLTLLGTDTSTHLVTLPGLTTPLLAASDNTGQLGSTALRWLRVHSQNFEVRAASGDTQPSTRLLDRALRMGTGGSNALDVGLERQAAGVLKVTDAAGGIGSILPSHSVVISTTNRSLTAGDDLVIFNGTSLTATLPDPATATKRAYVVKNINASAATVSSAGTSKTIDGAASKSLAQWEKATYWTDGNQWYVVA